MVLGSNVLITYTCIISISAETCPGGTPLKTFANKRREIDH